MTRTRTVWVRRGAIAIAGILVVAFAVGSLGGSSNLTAPSRTSDEVRGGDLGGGTGVVPGSVAVTQQSARLGEDEIGGGAGIPAALPTLGDRIARTLEIAVEVDEGRFDAAWTAAGMLAERYGGYVLTSNRGGGSRASAGTGDQVPFGEITLRVPSDRLGQAARDIRALGEVRGETQTSQDVTQEYVDLQSRLRNLRAQEAVLLRLMRRANSIEDTITVQGRLSDVQMQIEQIQGRINYLNARTDFATIALRVSEPGGIVTGSADGPSFAKAWATALEGLVRMGTAALILGVWAAPFALLAVVALSVRRRARRPAPQA